MAVSEDVLLHPDIWLESTLVARIVKDSKVCKALEYRLKGSAFDPRLDDKRRGAHLEQMIVSPCEIIKIVSPCEK
jgi:hypothetical protein